MVTTKRRGLEQQFQTQLDRILWAAKHGSDPELLLEMMKGASIAKRFPAPTPPETALQRNARRQLEKLREKKNV